VRRAEDGEVRRAEDKRMRRAEGEKFRGAGYWCKRLWVMGSR